MRTGLRTEIILSLSLLLAAALLFAGFLLVKLTERNLLDQQREHATDVTVLIATAVTEPAHAADTQYEKNMIVRSLERLQIVLGRRADILAWRVVDNQMRDVARTFYRGPAGEFTTISPSTLEPGEIYEELTYETFSLFSSTAQTSFLDLSVPLLVGTEPFGLMQIRFDLAALQERVQGAQKLILICVIVYGLVLMVFGVYLLNRNVVKPVRLLHRATTEVASGSLTSVNVRSGPGEIHELADSFNQMVDALAASRAETEAHIATLEETNSALQRARDDLVRSEKLATVGYLAAGMAHEIGNPLGAVIGYLNILKEDLSEDAQDLVERSLAETGRIDRLVRELLEYSAPVDHQSESFCPVTLLRETVEMLRHQGQFDAITVEDSCQSEQCLVTMDRGRLMQVWINLLLNARDAMAGEGAIQISSHLDNEQIQLSVQDQGEGIGRDDLKEIFEPFYTTKHPGKGYGLGLAVCQRIINENHGTIDVDSRAGGGTTFTVTLPCDIEDTV